MKSIKQILKNSMNPIHMSIFAKRPTWLLLFGTILLVGSALPLVFAQSRRGRAAVLSGKAETLGNNGPSAAEDRPASMQGSVQVMVELSELPAAVLHAQALKEARAEADAARTYALAHPNAPGSQELIKGTKKVEISAAAASQVESHAQHLNQVQQGMLPSLTGSNVNGRVLFRVQHAYNGIALVVSPKHIASIAQMPGVKAVHVMRPKQLNTAFSDIDFLRARLASPNGGLWTTGNVRGETIKVADIDTGLDYVHANFGGNGNYNGVDDTHASGHFPSAKVPGGTDLVGDSYNADPNDPAFQPIPHPDNNPFDCNGHGTSTASLIAGFGENNDGTTYTGTYDATNPTISNLKISPGFAPMALLYPVRVFGCAGPTNAVTQAIDWAIANHMDVINMSLGSNESPADDPDSVAASNAAAAGILVCSAAGNAGDTYYVHSSPAAAGGTLSVAATFNDQGGFISNASVTANTAGAGGVGTKYGAIYGSTSPHVGAGGLTNDVVYAIPHIANAALTNAAQVNGKICLIDRGSVTFVSKIHQAQAAGAVAVIMVNNVPGDPIVMALDNTVTIPSVMISQADGTTIKNAAAFDATTGVAHVPCNVTINNDNSVVTHSGAPDTIPSYSARGPRLPDSALKPDVAAPAEVVGVATHHSGTAVQNFNGTSSATPHVAGTMALLRQLHPTWSVQELNALVTDTATHDLFTDTSHTVQYGVGRIGAGRIDLTNAANANVVAFNGSDSNLQGVSFGVVETPVTGASTLTKNITVENKGATDVTYNLSVQDDPALAGASFSFPNGTSFTISAGATTTVPVKFTATGSALKHAREASAPQQLPAGLNRQWLTEAGGYAVFTPTDGSPTLRVALYAAPKPVSAMHSGAPTNEVDNEDTPTGAFDLNLSGDPVNTGSNLGAGFDILSLVKPFELQFARQPTSPPPPANPNVIRFVGVTSDYTVNSNKANTRITFGIEGFGDAATPDFSSSDKEIFIDTNSDGTFDFAIFLSSAANGTAPSNAYFPVLVNLHTGAASIPGFRTNLLSPAAADTNSFNNSAVLISIPAAALGDPAHGLPALASPGGPTAFKYVVVTFDRQGNQVDQSPVLTYDLANAGFDLEGGNLEPFYYVDVPSSIQVNFSKLNFKSNGTRGIWLVHMHNGDGQRSDAIPFRNAVPFPE